VSERVERRRRVGYRLKWSHSGAWDYALTVSERVKERRAGHRLGWPQSRAWDSELTVSERVKEKERRVGCRLG
jgi:hypothetical protein